jgi:N-acetyl-gamma-glutamyl-phosphate reductase common form
MKKVAIYGASGYVGGELLRLLVTHKEVEIVAATSRRHAGQALTDVHPNLRGFTDLTFSNDTPQDVAGISDLVFFALPHCQSMALAAGIVGKTRIIDLAADFRLKNPETFMAAYKIEHANPGLISEFEYGMPETNMAALRHARNVANPGCFPTGALLALWPLAKAGLLKGETVVDSKTGSSGSGAEPSVGAHHPERAHDFRAYKIFAHQHQSEIEQGLGMAAGGNCPSRLTFVAHSAPMVRGIFTTAYAFLPREMEKGGVEALYREFYKGAPFVRIVPQSRSASVQGTNFCDIAIEQSGDRVVVTSAIDNLVKGAAGTAVQNMNILFGLDERAGLFTPGYHP